MRYAWLCCAIYYIWMLSPAFSEISIRYRTFRFSLICGWNTICKSLYTAWTVVFISFICLLNRLLTSKQRWAAAMFELLCIGCGCFNWKIRQLWLLYILFLYYFVISLIIWLIFIIPTGHNLSIFIFLVKNFFRIGLWIFRWLSILLWGARNPSRRRWVRRCTTLRNKWFADLIDWLYGLNRVIMPCRYRSSYKRLSLRKP